MVAEEWVLMAPRGSGAWGSRLPRCLARTTARGRETHAWVLWEPLPPGTGGSLGAGVGLCAQKAQGRRDRPSPDVHGVETAPLGVRAEGAGAGPAPGWFPARAAGATRPHRAPLSGLWTAASARVLPSACTRREAGCCGH